MTRRPTADVLLRWLDRPRTARTVLLRWLVAALIVYTVCASVAALVWALAR